MQGKAALDPSFSDMPQAKADSKGKAADLSFQMFV
jgi:hypothetical protein